MVESLLYPFLDVRVKEMHRSKNLLMRCITSPKSFHSRCITQKITFTSTYHIRMNFPPLQYIAPKFSSCDISHLLELSISVTTFFVSHRTKVLFCATHHTFSNFPSLRQTFYCITPMFCFMQYINVIVDVTFKK
jgi:hypothetical protein